jgi:hypothetical protein
MTTYQHQRRTLMRMLAICMLGGVLFAMVMGVSALTFHLLDQQKKLQSQCPALVKEWQAVGVPKHIQIKCKEFLT